MLTFRPAAKDDAERLFAWRNDPLTREMSRCADPVNWDQHMHWLSARLQRNEPHLYIAHLAGNTVGTFRIDDGEISYTVAPEHRGKGIATEMLKLALTSFGSMKAEIYPRNIASIRAARAAGHLVILLA